MNNKYAVIEQAENEPTKMQLFDTLTAARDFVEWARQDDATGTLLLVVQIIDYMEC